MARQKPGRSQRSCRLDLVQALRQTGGFVTRDWSRLILASLVNEISTSRQKQKQTKKMWHFCVAFQRDAILFALMPYS